MRQRTGMAERRQDAGRHGMDGPGAASRREEAGVCVLRFELHQLTVKALPFAIGRGDDADLVLRWPQLEEDHCELVGGAGGGVSLPARSRGIF